MRNIENVINTILDMVPESFNRKSELRVRLGYVIDDLRFRSPDLICIAWQDATLILKEVLMDETENSIYWNWVDDVFDFFSEGKWRESVSYKICKVS